MLRNLSSDERVNSAIVRARVNLASRALTFFFLVSQVHTAFNLLGLCTVCVCYLNYVMIADYFTPVFLASVLAVLLRGPRDAIAAIPIVEAIKTQELHQSRSMLDEEAVILNLRDVPRVSQQCNLV